MKLRIEKPPYTVEEEYAMWVRVYGEEGDVLAQFLAPRECNDPIGERNNADSIARAVQRAKIFVAAMNLVELSLMENK